MYIILMKRLSSKQIKDEKETVQPINTCKSTTGFKKYVILNIIYQTVMYGLLQGYGPRKPTQNADINTLLTILGSLFLQFIFFDILEAIANEYETLHSYKKAQDGYEYYRNNLKAKCSNFWATIVDIIFWGCYYLIVPLYAIGHFIYDCLSLVLLNSLRRFSNVIWGIVEPIFRNLYKIMLDILSGRTFNSIIEKISWFFNQIGILITTVVGVIPKLIDIAKKDIDDVEKKVSKVDTKKGSSSKFEADDEELYNLILESFLVQNDKKITDYSQKEQNELHQKAKDAYLKAKQDEFFEPKKEDEALYTALILSNIPSNKTLSKLTPSERSEIYQKSKFDYEQYRTQLGGSQHLVEQGLHEDAFTITEDLWEKAKKSVFGKVGACFTRKVVVNPMKKIENIVLWFYNNAYDYDLEGLYDVFKKGFRSLGSMLFDIIIWLLRIFQKQYRKVFEIIQKFCIPQKSESGKTINFFTGILIPNIIPLAFELKTFITDIIRLCSGDLFKGAQLGWSSIITTFWLVYDKVKQYLRKKIKELVKLWNDFKEDVAEMIDNAKKDIGAFLKILLDMVVNSVGLFFVISMFTDVAKNTEIFNEEAEYIPFNFSPGLKMNIFGAAYNRLEHLMNYIATQLGFKKNHKDRPQFILMLGIVSFSLIMWVLNVTWECFSIVRNMQATRKDSATPTGKVVRSGCLTKVNVAVTGIMVLSGTFAQVVYRYWRDTDLYHNSMINFNLNLQTSLVELREKEKKIFKKITVKSSNNDVEEQIDDDLELFNDKIINNPRGNTFDLLVDVADWYKATNEAVSAAGRLIYLRNVPDGKMSIDEEDKDKLDKKREELIQTNRKFEYEFNSTFKLWGAKYHENGEEITFEFSDDYVNQLHWNIKKEIIFEFIGVLMAAVCSGLMGYYGIFFGNTKTYSETNDKDRHVYDPLKSNRFTSQSAAEKDIAEKQRKTCEELQKQIEEGKRKGGAQQFSAMSFIMLKLRDSVNKLIKDLQDGCEYINSYKPTDTEINSILRDSTSFMYCYQIAEDPDNGDELIHLYKFIIKVILWIFRLITSLFFLYFEGVKKAITSLKTIVYNLMKPLLSFVNTSSRNLLEALSYKTNKKEVGNFLFYKEAKPIVASEFMKEQDEFDVTVSVDEAIEEDVDIEVGPIMSGKHAAQEAETWIKAKKGRSKEYKFTERWNNYRNNQNVFEKAVIGMRRSYTNVHKIVTQTVYTPYLTDDSAAKIAEAYVKRYSNDNVTYIYTGKWLPNPTIGNKLYYKEVTKKPGYGGANLVNRDLHYYYKFKEVEKLLNNEKNKAHTEKNKNKVSKKKSSKFQ
jgi:hypothetical protein